MSSARSARKDYTKRWKRVRRQLVRLEWAERGVAGLRQPERPPLQLPEESGIMPMSASSVSSSEEDSSVAKLELGGVSAMAMEMKALRTSMDSMAQRMDSIEGKIDEVLSHLRGPQSPPSVPVEDMLPSPCSTVSELQKLDGSLVDQERRNKMLLFLASIGGSSAGDAIRRMLRRVASNNVLKEYSLRGRKTKMAFQGLIICWVITAAAQRNFPALNGTEAEDLIGKTLKFAPHRR